MSYARYNQIAINNIENVLDKLNVEYRMRGDIVALKCPIHDSTKIGNSTIKLDCGIFKCWSGGCHETYGSSILGLIRGCLSKDLKEPVEMQAVINFLMDPSFKLDNTRTVVTHNTDIVYMDESKYPSVTIPSKYFVNRKFSPEILTKFKIGDTNTFPYNDRAVVPIRHDNGKLLGFSARSHFEKCPKCEYHHSRFQGCISDDYEYAHMFKKWIHSKGTQKSKTLYNIENTVGPKVAMVEGPSCVWRLDEFGIQAVACLGKTVSPYQMDLLKQKGVEKILFVSDNDDAGKEFKNSFVMNYYGKFDIYLPILTAKDISEMSTEDIKNNILKKWDKI